MSIVGQFVGQMFVLGISVKRDKSAKDLFNCLCFQCGKCSTKTRQALHTASSKRNPDIACGCKKFRSKFSLSVARNIKRALKNYKHHAMERNLSWEISDSQAVELMRCDCFYCGAPASNCTNDVDRKTSISPNRAKPFYYNGIDRIDNNAGYEIGNIVPACKNCNAYKSDSPFTEFRDWAIRLGDNMKKSKFTTGMAI